MKTQAGNEMNNIAGECPIPQGRQGSVIYGAKPPDLHLHNSPAFLLDTNMRDDNYTYVKLRRSIIGWEWFRNHKMYKLFTYLFMMAQHKPIKYMGYDLLRGQLITGRKRISSDTGLTEAETKHFLNKLKLSGEIQTTTNKHFTVVTICKYELYQGDTLDNSQQDSQPTANQQPTDTTCKNGKNVNNNTEALVFSDSKPKSKPKKQITPPEFLALLPESHRISQVEAAITDWLKYRADIKKPVYSMGADRQARDMAAHSVSEVLESINNSLKNGWTGLFFKQVTNHYQPAQPVKPTVRPRFDEIPM